MRGKAIIGNHFNVSAGITPAYAGKSHTAFLFAHVKEDHPRLCGEKLNFPSTRSITSGSPPPMRGKDGRFSRRYLKLGITPAYAGKSCTHTTAETASRDHPRLCGEKIFSSFSHAPQTGSPPPMRGKEKCKPHKVLSKRITPAYAGKSFR